MDPVAAVLALLVVILAAWERRQVTAAFVAERKAWADERAELLTRIQRPDIIPARHVQRVKREPPKDAGNLAKIGTIAQPPKDAA